MLRDSLQRSAALAMLVALATTGCDSEPTRDEPETPDEAPTGDVQSPAPPQVPGAPSPDDRTTPDRDRSCLRRAAGIAGWRDYLREWSSAPPFDVALPSGSPNGPTPESVAVVVAPGFIAVDGEKVVARGAGDAGRPNWSSSAIQKARSAIDEYRGRRKAGSGDDDADSRPLEIAAHPQTPASTLAQLLEPGGDDSTGAPVSLVVRDAANPPPVDEPRPQVGWLEELIATFERTTHVDARHQLLDDAMHRTLGRCSELRPLLEQLYLKEPKLADKRTDPDVDEETLVEALRSCSCRGVKMKALEALVVWRLQPLAPPLATFRTSLAKLRRADDRSVDAVVPEPGGE